MTPSLVRTISLFVVIAAAAAIHMFAQDRLKAPNLGHVLTPDGFLQEIEGIPGASRYVSATDRARYRALYSASHAHASVMSTADALVILGLPSRRVPLDDPRAVAISPTAKFIGVVTGDRLAVYAVSDFRVKTTNLITLGFDPVGGLCLAVSDDGTALLASPGSLAVVARTHTAFAPLTITFPRFLPNSARAVAYSPAEKALLLVHTDNLAIERLLAPVDGLTVPTGVEFVGPNTLWISQTGPDSLLSYSLETRLATRYSLESNGALRSLGFPGVYLWSDSSLLDARGPSPRIVWIAASEDR